LLSAFQRRERLTARSLLIVATIDGNAELGCRSWGEGTKEKNR
jgi:hypothetical protein